jgi:hypothetical protein
MHDAKQKQGLKAGAKTSVRDPWLKAGATVPCTVPYLLIRNFGTHLHIIADNSFASNAMVISNGLSVIYVYSRPYSIVMIYYSRIYH